MWELDKIRRKLIHHKGNEQVDEFHLTPICYTILAYLIENANMAVHYRMLIEVAKIASYPSFLNHMKVIRKIPDIPITKIEKGELRGYMWEDKSLIDKSPTA